MKECLADTDIFSYYMRGIPHVVSHARKYLKQFGYFNISALTVFEVLKGLRKKKLAKKEKIFRAEMVRHHVIGLDYFVADKAATLLTELEKKGTPVAHADLFIAATALTSNLALVTNNTSHFSKIGELILENWMEL